MIPVDRVLAELAKLYVQLQIALEENALLKKQIADAQGKPDGQ